ncbi:alpha/beta hydrolase [Corynebacterium anserum]|nr:alpha/beta hydrolase-fold protein [Corynebacterium anserum]MBC2681792.1 hypothetical protein [Corynebacterium anserum]
MLDFIRSIPLQGTAATTATWIFLILSIALLIRTQAAGKQRRIGVVCLILSIILAAPLLGTLIFGYGIPLNEIPRSLIIASILLFTAFFLTCVAIYTHWRKTWTILPLAVVTVCTMLVGNQAYGLYPDLEALIPSVSYNEAQESDIPQVKNTDHTIPADQWTPSPDMPEMGTRVSMHVPTPQSKFQARNADVYLPPAWFTSPRPELPVLVLMHGIPGAPDQWIDEAGALKPVANYQKNHNGLAPIIVSIDSTGGWVKNPLCTDSPQANITTYLTKDIPQWLIKRLGANQDQQTWTLGGLSYGGTCALQTLAQHPESYGAFLDYSGEFTPNDSQSHKSTVKDFFNNNEDLFKKRNPADIFTSAANDNSDKFEGLEGRFVAGTGDRSAQKDLTRLNALANKVGIQSTFRAIPGRHDFRVWRTAIAQDFGFVIERGELPK